MLCMILYESEEIEKPRFDFGDVKYSNQAPAEIKVSRGGDLRGHVYVILEDKFLPR